MHNPFSAKSFSTTFSHRMKRAGKADTQDAVVLIAVGTLSIILLLGITGVISFSTVKSPTSVPNSGKLQLYISDSAQQGASALTSPNANLFYTSTGQGVSADNPGSLSSAFTTKGSYALDGSLTAQVTATGAYPIWAPLNGQPVTMGGVTVLNYGTSPGSVAGTTVYTLQFTQIAAPASGTSATTNVAASMALSNGNAITTAISTSPIEYYNNLQIKSTYSGAGYVENVPSTSSNSVMNLATGQVLPQGQTESFQLVNVIFVNSTNVFVNLAADAPAGLTLTKVTNTAMPSGSEAFVVSGFTGCAPTTGSVTTYNCESAPVNIYESGGSSSKKADVVSVWADMQQPQAVVANAVGAALTSYPAAGASAGLPTGFTFLGSTSGSNSGAPAVLIEQSYAFIAAL